MFHSAPPLRVLAATLLAATLLPACDAIMGKEVARLPINALSAPGQDAPKEVTVELKKGEEVAVWSEMDMSYQGEQQLQFQLAVLRDGQPFEQLAFDPREKDLSIKEVKTNVNGDVSWSFAGRNRTLRIPETGRYTFRGRLLAQPAHGPEIRKAELVLRK